MQPIVGFNSLQIQDSNPELYTFMTIGSKKDPKQIKYILIDYYPMNTRFKTHITSKTLINFFYILTGPRSYKVQKGLIVDEIEIWPREWTVKTRFIIHSNPLEDTTIWANIIHFTEGADHNVYGSRIPALFLQRHEKWMHLSINIINSDGDYENFFNTVPYEVNKEYDVVFQTESTSTTTSGGQEIYKSWFSVNGVVIEERLNYVSQDLTNVKVPYLKGKI